MRSVRLARIAGIRAVSPHSVAIDGTPSERVLRQFIKSDRGGFHQVIVKRTVTSRRDAANTLVRHGGAEAASPHGVKQENDYKMEAYNV